MTRSHSCSHRSVAGAEALRQGDLGVQGGEFQIAGPWFTLEQQLDPKTVSAVRRSPRGVGKPPKGG